MFDLACYRRNDQPFFLIAGPCVLESAALAFSVAETLTALTERLNIPFIFKSSFDKANRTSGGGHRGPGLDEGLRILSDIKKTFGCPLITDVHLPEQCAAVAEVVDVLQIPAFLCRQTDLIAAAAATHRPLNIKKGQFLSPPEMQNVIHKAQKFGSQTVMACERGTTFGYNNLVVDMRSLSILKTLGVPIVFDATHSVQRPGASQTSSGGERQFVETLARAALAVGVAGLYMETHPDPDQALSDGPNMVPLDQMEGLLQTLQEVDTLSKKLPYQPFSKVS
jgi:2-dehydro-3-deoxyphosphooctonate aldolase (KDO 8-P synthase)